MADCGKELMERFGYTAKDAKDLLDEVRQSGVTSDERVRLAREKIAIQSADRARRDYTAKLNAVKFADLRQHVEPFREKYGAWEGAKSLAAGSDKPVDNAQASIGREMFARVKGAGGDVMRDLRKNAGADIFPWFADKNFDYEAGKAKFYLHDEAHPYTPPEGDIGKKAMAVAQVFDKYHEQGRIGLNNAGANVGPAANYVSPTTHDAGKIMKAGKEQWINDILPFLDTEKTFAKSNRGALSTRADPTEPLGQIWKKITDGTWGTYSDERLGGGDLADRLGASRELIFKDYDSLHAYNQKYGRGSMIEGMQHHVDNQQKNIALLERMGTNPSAMAKKLLASYGTEIRPRDIQIGKFKVPLSLKPSAEIMFKTMLGLDNVPGDPRFANMMRYVRQTQDMAHLGSSFASQIPDLATIGARADFNGMGFLDAQANGVAAFVKGKAGGELRDIAEDWAIYTDGVLGHHSARLGAFDSPDGTMSALTEKFYKWAGITRWDDSQREGFGFFMLNNYSRQVRDGKAFDALPADMQTNLRRYGIQASDWARLTPDMVHVVDETGRKLLNYESTPGELAQKLRTLLVSESQQALPLPGLYERAFMLRGTQPGTYAGEMARFFARYKGVSIRMGTGVLPMVVQTGSVGAVAFYLADAAALGYLSYTARELMNGRTAPDPRNPQTVLQSLMKSGGLGYAGDLILSMGEGMNKSAMDVVSGVTGSTLSNAYRIGQQIVENARDPEKKHDIGSKVFRMAMSETPFVNLWYAKLALNYLFSWHVQEALNPGYLRRAEARIKKDQGNQYMVPPTSVIKTGGGFR